MHLLAPCFQKNNLTEVLGVWCQQESEQGGIHQVKHLAGSLRTFAESSVPHLPPPAVHGRGSVQPGRAPRPQEPLAPPASILTAREAKTSPLPGASAIIYECFECAQYYLIVNNLVVLCSHLCLSTTCEPSCSTAKLLVSFVWLC